LPAEQPSLFKEAVVLHHKDKWILWVILWIRDQLTKGIQVLTLNSQKMRQPCPPGQKRTFLADGSNLPVLIRELRNKSPKAFQDWIGHLQSALPFLKSVRVGIREHDRSLYIIVRDRHGREIPSWLLSDGALRILALTLLAYLPENQGIYLIEEPENGVHPLAIQDIYDSLSSVYQGQILVATHSPVLLSVARPEEILCFSRKETGEAQIINGDKHPVLREWKGTPNLDILYASGVLD
jgi:predicted ATPase